ncbi:hypothetical protein ACH492_36455 [Streptomyces sp. NPDC019443]|uniref:hypothetical protein n=1 Tax=Streptomyces sp. NPDC019443 TaxID=3365061 RepID=UPI0037887561
MSGGCWRRKSRKNGWQLAEYAGHRDPAGLQHLLNGARWDADAVRDDVPEYVAERLGPDGVLIVDDRRASSGHEFSLEYHDFEQIDDTEVIRTLQAASAAH